MQRMVIEVDNALLGEAAEFLGTTPSFPAGLQQAGFGSVDQIPGRGALIETGE